jgi:hypothetical protein
MPQRLPSVQAESQEGVTFSEQEKFYGDLRWAVLRGVPHTGTEHRESSRKLRLACMGTREGFPRINEYRGLNKLETSHVLRPVSRCHSRGDSWNASTESSFRVFLYPQSSRMDSLELELWDDSEELADPAVA